MIFPIAKDDILCLRQCCERTLVGEETGGKEQGTFAAKERRQRLLQLVMERNRTIQQPGTGASSPKPARGVAGRLDDAGILSKTEVIIRPDHDLLLAAADDMVPVALLDAAKIGIKSLRSGICRIAVLPALLEKVSSHDSVN